MKEAFRGKGLKTGRSERRRDNNGKVSCSTKQGTEARNLCTGYNSTAKYFYSYSNTDNCYKELTKWQIRQKKLGFFHDEDLQVNKKVEAM